VVSNHDQRGFCGNAFPSCYKCSREIGPDNWINTTEVEEILPGDNTTEVEEILPGDNTTEVEEILPGDNTTEVEEILPGDTETPIGTAGAHNDLALQEAGKMCEKKLIIFDKSNALRRNISPCGAADGLISPVMMMMPSSSSQVKSVRQLVDSRFPRFLHQRHGGAALHHQQLIQKKLHIQKKLLNVACQCTDTLLFVTASSD
jgi:hypothetical protein